MSHLYLAAIPPVAVGGYLLYTKLLHRRPSDLSAADSWDIGPQIGKDDRSVGMPSHLAAVPGGIGFAFPVSTWNATKGTSDAYVKYVTCPYGSLAGKKLLRLKYRVTADAAARIVAATAEGGPSILTMYFQRSGDDWSGGGAFDGYRWWHKPSQVMPIVPGDYEIVAPLDAGWTGVERYTQAAQPQAFADALNDAAVVGFTFGGGSGLGHGVYADGGEAMFVVLSFSVE